MSDVGFYARLGLSIVGGIIGSYIGGIYFGVQVQSMIMGAGFMAGTMLGSYLFPTEQEDAALPKVGDMPMQSSSKGQPIPIIYGTVRLAGNVIWMDDLQVVNTKHSAGGGGKSFFGGGGGESYYETTYKRSFLIGICEGRTQVVRAWIGKVEIPISDFTWFDGSGNAGISDLIGEEFAEYKTVSCALFEDYSLGRSQALPQLIFEVSRSGFFNSWNLNGTTYKTIHSEGVYLEAGSEVRFVSTTGVTDTVAIPLKGHDFEVGQFIDIKPGAYAGNHEIQDITLDEVIIHIANPYTPTTFTGDELVLKINTTSMTYNYTGYHKKVGRYIYAGCTHSGSQCLIKIDTNDMSEDANFFDKVFPDVSSYGYEVKISSDGLYLDFLVITGLFIFSIHRFLLADGSHIYITEVVDYSAWAYSPDNRLLTVHDAQIASVNPLTGGLSPISSRSPVVGNKVLVSYTDPTLGVNVNYVADDIFKNGLVDFSKGVNVSVDELPQGVDEAEVDFWTSDYWVGVQLFYVHRGFYRGGYVYTFWDTFTQGGESVNVIRAKVSLAIGVGVLGQVVIEVDVNNDYYYFPNANNMYEGMDGNIWISYSSGDGIRMYDNDFVEEKTFDYYNTALLSGGNAVWQGLSTGSLGYDENPSTIIKDLLTNNKYGAGMPLARLDEDYFDAVYDYCQTREIGLSLVINTQKPIYDWIDYICSHYGGYRSQHNGVFSLGVYRDEASAFTLTRDDIVGVEVDGAAAPAVKMQKRRYSETANRVEIVWTDRTNLYAAAVAIAHDEVDQRLCGQIRKRTISLAGVTNPELAQRMAYRLLIESMYRFTVFSFMVAYENMLLEVGDVGTLSDGFLISEQKIRILSISEDLDGRGLSIEATEEREGLYPDIIYPDSQQGLWERETAPTLLNSTIHFLEAQTSSSLRLCIVPGNEYTGGWYILRSYDGITYDIIGRAGIDGVTAGDANSSGILTTALEAASSVVHRKTEEFTVSIGTVTDLSSDITDEAFFNNLKLARIDDEIIAYLDCVESATEGIWTVTNLIRGLYGTEATAHAIGASFVTLDTNFTYTYRDEDVGKWLYFKAAVYYGEQAQEVTEPAAALYNVQGKVTRPDGVGLLRLTSDEMDGGGLEYSGASFTLYWNLPGIRGSGFNHGGFDLNSIVPEWRYGDDELDLTGGGGINYGYQELLDLMQDIKLEFYESDGTTLIGTRNILATATSETITYATDLDSNGTAVIKVIPRTNKLSLTERSITVTKV